MNLLAFDAFPQHAVVQADGSRLADSPCAHCERQQARGRANRVVLHGAVCPDSLLGCVVGHVGDHVLSSQRGEGSTCAPLSGQGVGAIASRSESLGRAQTSGPRHWVKRPADEHGTQLACRASTVQHRVVGTVFANLELAVLEVVPVVSLKQVVPLVVVEPSQFVQTLLLQVLQESRVVITGHVRERLHDEVELRLHGLLVSGLDHTVLLRVQATEERGVLAQLLSSYVLGVLLCEDSRHQRANVRAKCLDRAGRNNGSSLSRLGGGAVSEGTFHVHTANVHEFFDAAVVLRRSLAGRVDSWGIYAQNLL